MPQFPSSPPPRPIGSKGIEAAEFEINRLSARVFQLEEENRKLKDEQKKWVIALKSAMGLSPDESICP